ncbi:MAG: site-specific integrase [Armatimonadetes bacterium]|nr:site-specific integrase [Armatimonadota bacterium]
MKGSMKERSPGSWTLWIELPRDPVTHRRKQKTLTVKGTKRQAQAELNRVLAEVQNGGFVNPSRLTTGAFLVRWLEDYARVNVAGRTFERYSEIIRAHLIPALGSIPLSKLQPLHIQACHARALQKGRLHGKGGLSPTTVVLHHRILREALQQAVKWQLLPRNVCDSVEPPQRARVEMRALNEAETVQLFLHARGSRMFAPIVLAVASGVRRGELLALRWSDVDLQAGRLTVCRSLEATKAGLAFKPPKTQKGRRLPPLPAFAVRALGEHRRTQSDERRLFGKDYCDSDLVFALPDGQPIHPDHFSKWFVSLVRGVAGFPRVRLHDLRHTCATLLLRQGVHPKIVSERLGHATVAITLDTYSHVLPGMQEDAVRRMDAALGAAMAPTRPALPVPSALIREA